jgi:hypothetical protein
MIWSLLCLPRWRPRNAEYLVPRVNESALLAVLILLASGTTCVAQAQRVKELPRKIDDAQRIMALNVRLGDNIHARLSRGEMEEMLYGKLGGSRQAFRRLRRESIQRYIDRVDKVCGLDEVQKKKIDASIDIDIARTESMVASLLSELQETTAPARKKDIYDEAWASISDHQTKESLLDDSIWRKVLHSILTKEQWTQLEEDQHRVEQRTADSKKHRLLLGMQRRLGLNRTQRKWLSDLVFRSDQPALVTMEQLRSILLEMPRSETPLTDSQFEKLKTVTESISPFPGEGMFDEDLQ